MDIKDLVAATLESGQGGRELSELAGRVGEVKDLWLPVAMAADGKHRHWREIYADDHVDIYAISWLPGQTTGFHDHCSSHFGVVCVQGAVVEERLCGVDAERDQRRLEGRGATFGGPGMLHLIRWEEGAPAITIHCYSPKLLRVGQYYYADGLNWVRRERDGHEELTEGALPC